MSGDLVLQARNVIAGYHPGLPIIHGINATIRRGEIVTVIGPNGAGKSTFVKAIAGLVNITSGEVLLGDQVITGLPSHQLAKSGVGYVPQTANVFTTLSIHENLVMGSVSLSKARARLRIDQMYTLYPFLRERKNEKAGVLSGGQRQTLAVARALLTEPTLMLLDEPTAGLSPRAAMEMFDVITGLVGEGVAILMVEQNARAALRISDRCYVLAEGQNRAEGPARTLLDDPEIGEIFLGVRRKEEAQ